MRCDSRVVSLRGIQVVNDTVEDGNHLQAFVGTEHGFFKDVLTIYRRSHADKLARLRYLQIPVRKDELLASIRPDLWGRKIPVTLETNDPTLKLPARLCIAKSREVATLEISFPGLVGYLEMHVRHSFGIPGPASILSDLQDRIHGSDIFVLSADGAGPHLTLRNRSRTGLRVSKIIRMLSRFRDHRIVRAMSRLLGRIGSVLRPQAVMKVVALYDGELVTIEGGDVQGGVSLTNVPLDEIRITAPLSYGFRIEFLLMEEDAAQGAWTKVEDLPGPQKMLDWLDTHNAAQVFDRLLRTRFWPDVRNRFLNRGQPGESVGWPAIRQLYGGQDLQSFRELADLVRMVYEGPGWVQRIVFGPRVAGGHRSYQSVYSMRNYDPDQLALLITLALDVNIATLLGLNTVDRGQHPELPERTLDAGILKKHQVVDWRQGFDYKVQGRWPHLQDIYTFIYYDLDESTTPHVEGKVIAESETLGGVEVGVDEDGSTPVRFYKVGLRWDIAQDHRNALLIAYDIYRDSQLLTVEKPMTPARAEEKPTEININGRSVPFHPSLPVIPPFSPPQEIGPAEFQYVDTGARFGTTTYTVESVDIFGRYSADHITRSHQVKAPVPIPGPADLRAEIRQTEDGGFEVVTRWDWPAGHRALAPDWVRFEVFFHDKYKAGLYGTILWIEKQSTGSASSKFAIEAFVDTRNLPVPLESLSSVSDNSLLLRSAGRTYHVSEITVHDGVRPGVGLISSKIEAKDRVGSIMLSAMLDGTRGVLLKRSSGGVLRVPFLVSGTAEPEALLGAAAVEPVQILVSKANAAQCSSGESVRVLLGDFLLAGTITDVDIDGADRALDGIAVETVRIQFDEGWAEYHLPVPGSACTWLRGENQEWIDWDDASNWAEGPVPLERPVEQEYPLQTDEGPQNQFPVTISATPEPLLNQVTDQSGQLDWSLSSVILSTEGFAAASDSLFTGCRIGVGGFNQFVRQNLKGQGPQIITTTPENFTQDQAIAMLQGQQALLSQAGGSYTGSVKGCVVNVGETKLEVTFSQALPLQEWCLCALCAKAEALPNAQYEELPPIPLDRYYFRILAWRKIVEDGKTYEFIVSNLVLDGEVVVDGIEEDIEFEVAPVGDSVDIIVPELHSVTFDLAGISSAGFYRQVDGGEMAYQVTRDPREPNYDPQNPNETVEVLCTAIGVSRTRPSGTEKLHVAFFPALNSFSGFKLPPSNGPLKFYPSFRLAHSPTILNEQSMRDNVPIYVTVRAIAQEDGPELPPPFTGPLAPAVKASMARGRLDLSPLPALPFQPTPDSVPVYAFPGPRGSTYTLSWAWDASEFKVYRIPADYVEQKAQESGQSVRQVLNDYSLVEPVLSLRNRSQLRQSTFTDCFESRGGGRYYYKVLALDEAGLALDETGTPKGWTNALIIPHPEQQGPVIVPNTVPPDPPTLKTPNVVNGKVQLEWQSDPAADEYWIYRTPDFEPTGPLKLKVDDIDDVTVHARLERAPIVVGTESELIRCKGSSPAVLDLFWMPDMYQVIGLYPADEYREWISGDRGSVENRYPGNMGEIVLLKHRDGSEEDIRLDASLVWGDAARTEPGPQLAIEYLTEHEVRLSGYFEVKNQEIVVRRSLDIAELVGVYKLEDFDPENPQNPLSGTLHLGDAYPIIKDIQDGNTVVQDGYRPVIVYKEDPDEPELTIFGDYPVQNGVIELVSGPELPLLDGESAADPMTLPATYTQPAHLVAGLYRQSDYDTDPATAQNLYNNSYDGTKITGINLPDGEPVVVVVRQLKVHWADRVTYQSLRIEGYPQAVKIDAVMLADRQTGTLQPIELEPDAFDPTNPDVLSLAHGSLPTPPPPSEVIVRYTDDAGMQRSVTVVADSDNLTVAAGCDSLHIGRADGRPAGLAPYIKDFLGVWRLADYAPENPDPALNLVDEQDNLVFRRQGSLLQVHIDAGLSVRENGEPVPLVIRFRDHKDAVRNVAFKPGWLRFTDETPYLDTKTIYRVKVVKIWDYQENSQPQHLEIASRLSEPREVTLMDPTPPVPPELQYEGLDGNFPVLSWAVVEGIIKYWVQRREEGLPSWTTDPQVLEPLPGEVEMSYTDKNVQRPKVYYYRLSVVGTNGKTNTVYQDPAMKVVLS
jgi:hypothetical protein